MKQLSEIDVERVSGGMTEDQGIAALGVVAAAGMIGGPAGCLIAAGIIGICGIDIARHILKF